MGPLKVSMQTVYLLSVSTLYLAFSSAAAPPESLPYEEHATQWILQDKWVHFILLPF